MYVGGVLTDAWIERPPASDDPLASKNRNMSVVSAAQIAVRPILGIHRSLQHNRTCVVEGVTATTAPGGDPAAESLTRGAKPF